MDVMNVEIDRFAICGFYTIPHIRPQKIFWSIMTKINRFEKKYTVEDIKKVLDKTPGGLMLAIIQSEMGCSEMTARALLKPLIESGEVIKLNIGRSEKKPVNLYMLKR